MSSSLFWSSRFENPQIPCKKSYRVILGLEAYAKHCQNHILEEEVENYLGPYSNINRSSSASLSLLRMSQSTYQRVIRPSQSYAPPLPPLPPPPVPPPEDQFFVDIHAAFRPDIQLPLLPDITVNEVIADNYNGNAGADVAPLMNFAPGAQEVIDLAQSNGEENDEDGDDNDDIY